MLELNGARREPKTCSGLFSPDGSDTEIKLSKTKTTESRLGKKVKKSRVIFAIKLLRRQLLRIKNRGRRFILNLLTKPKSRKKLRRMYWNLRAHDIYEEWGEGTEDYDVIRHVISKVRPKRLLDIGCGNGRCFPLYDEMEVPEVCGQEISSKALAICRKRFPRKKFALINQDIVKLDIPDRYFDLILSTRVLAAVLPEDVAGVVRKLCSMGRYIYLNEMTDSDFAGSSDYWFLHQYDSLMAQNGFSVLESGRIGKQTWVLYKVSDDA